MKKPAIEKRCVNPGCGKTYMAGHYGARQQVCTGNYRAQCSRCKGSGKRYHAKCQRCQGKGKYIESCREWYRRHWLDAGRVPPYIPKQDLDKILDALTRDLSFRALILVASESGLRKGEILGLVWKDVLDGQEIRSVVTLRRQWDDIKGFCDTKTHKSRSAFLLSASRAIVKQLYDAKKRKAFDPESRIWQIAESKVWTRFTTLQRKIGVQNPATKRPYRFHDLRHTAGYRALKQTGQLPRVQVLLGHTNSATSMMYAKERPEEFVSEMDKAFERGRKGKKRKGAA